MCRWIGAGFKLSRTQFSGEVLSESWRVRMARYFCRFRWSDFDVRTCKSLSRYVIFEAFFASQSFWISSRIPFCMLLIVSTIFRVRSHFSRNDSCSPTGVTLRLLVDRVWPRRCLNHLAALDSRFFFANSLVGSFSVCFLLGLDLASAF